MLLHAYRLGFTAWQVSIMFTLYELAGVVTNLLAGLMGAKWGIKWTLLSGEALTQQDEAAVLVTPRSCCTMLCGGTNGACL